MSTGENGCSSHMSYHLTTTTTPSEREGNFKYYKDDIPSDSFEKDVFSAKKILYASDSILPPGPGHPRFATQSRMPLYMRRNSREGHGLPIPRNTLLIRGVDLLRGEDTDPHDSRLRAAERLSDRKRNILLAGQHTTKRDPSLEMLRIQRCPGTSQDPDGRYLDMSVPQHKINAEGNLNKHGCANIKKEVLGSAGNNVIHKQNGFRQAAIARKNIYQNSNSQSSKDETSSNTHHYLPMKVNSHVIIAKHRALGQQIEPNISVSRLSDPRGISSHTHSHAEYMLSDH